MPVTEIIKEYSETAFNTAMKEYEPKKWTTLAAWRDAWEGKICWCAIMAERED